MSPGWAETVAGARVAPAACARTGRPAPRPAVSKAVRTRVTGSATAASRRVPNALDVPVISLLERPQTFGAGPVYRRSRGVSAGSDSGSGATSDGDRHLTIGAFKLGRAGRSGSAPLRAPFGRRGAPLN